MSIQSFVRTLVLCVALVWNPPLKGGIPEEMLVLKRSFPVEGPKGIEPSGLCAVNGVLHTVSDKHDDTIFRVEVEGSVARLLPDVTFRAPEHANTRGKLDFEAVIPAGGGKGFYVGSEGAGDVLWVSGDGANASWIGLPIGEATEKAGLFKGANAGIEGLALREKGTRLLVAAERDPRGIALFSLSQSRTATFIHAESGPPPSSPLFPGRNPDFSDFLTIGTRLFAISRNAERIVELKASARGGEGWREVAAWSYSSALHLPQTEYEHRQFGMAEGFAVVGKSLWIIFDNNRSFLRAGPRDRRPLLLEFERPQNLR